MMLHETLTPLEIFKALKHQRIKWAGNRKLKIYGTLYCKSGKRMKKSTRVFFSSEDEALKEGYRPCGHCMRKAYQDWKTENLES
ncbi:Ada metal-binding domain-containing protein [Flagellimonas sp.]|uniref:Ada metal-binding domain-containing protein n=1 Tax=Flagellimonas sp. TaxID=2058762 RepID=UPI003B5A4AE2